MDANAAEEMRRACGRSYRKGPYSSPDALDDIACVDGGALADELEQLEKSPPRELAVHGLKPAQHKLLFECRILGKLTELCLSHSQGLGATGAAALARCARLANLRALSLQGKVTGTHLATILTSPHLKRLESLNLRWNGLGPAGARALARWPNTARLRSLHLGRTKLSHRVLPPLLRSKRLVHLGLDENAVGDEGARAIAAAPLPLTWLNLRKSRIADAGALALAGSPHLRELRFLGLGGNPIGPAALAALEKRFGEALYLDESFWPGPPPPPP